MRVRRFLVTPDIDVRLHDLPRAINVVAIDTRAMIFVFADDFKATSWSAISFPTAGYPGFSGSIPSAIEVGFLLLQAHDDCWLAGMPLRQVGRDHVADRGAATQARNRCGERTKL